uniref:cellulase n=1 Tax=Alexandrium catenella TaxID=2925 RepID=A0A7S1Q2X4_ALECA
MRSLSMPDGCPLPMPLAVILVAAVFDAARAQQAGKLQAEVQPEMPIQHCSKKAGCKKEQGGITVDESWRWIHGVGGYTNCLQGTTWEPTFCPDPATCARNCAAEGADLAAYAKNYGIGPMKDVPDSMELKYVAPGGAVASRVYLTGTDENYKVFKLKNRELTVDIDVSTVPCGLNAALYLIEMQGNGGKGIGNNTAGAKLGTGYCDAQCPRGVKFINGEANSVRWGMVPAKSPSGKTKKDGPVGQYGACCTEMDIFEGNREAAAFTAHPCQAKVQGLYRCNGTEECGDKGSKLLPGLCDKEGCGFNSWRMGDQKFFGKGADFKVDTSKPMTVVTQFITKDGTDTGDLSEIRRIWLQDGKIIKNSKATALGEDDAGRSLTDSECKAQDEAFDASGGAGSGVFGKYGGLKSVGEALDRGMVLSMSIWHDTLGRMLWLDGEKLHLKDKIADPGVSAGPCSFESGDPAELKKKHKDASVKFWNIKYGDIGSTFAAGEPKAKVAGKFEEVSDAGSGDATVHALRRSRSWAERATLPYKVTSYFGVVAAVGACALLAHLVARRSWRWLQSARDPSPCTYAHVVPS